MVAVVVVAAADDDDPFILMFLLLMIMINRPSLVVYGDVAFVENMMLELLMFLLLIR